MGEAPVVDELGQVFLRIPGARFKSDHRRKRILAALGRIVIHGRYTRGKTRRKLRVPQEQGKAVRVHLQLRCDHLPGSRAVSLPLQQVRGKKCKTVLEREPANRV